VNFFLICFKRETVCLPAERCYFLRSSSNPPQTLPTCRLFIPRKQTWEAKNISSEEIQQRKCSSEFVIEKLWQFTRNLY
jgi:hypothetical protein